MSNSQKDFIEPMIPVRINPIASTQDNLVWEDDERVWEKIDNPNGLTVAMDFYKPESDKYGYLRNYSIAQLMKMSVAEKFQLHEQHLRAEHKKLDLKVNTNKNITKTNLNKKSEIEVLDIKSDSKTPTPYSVMRFLTDRIGMEFVSFNSALYYFNGQKYVFLNYEDAITLLMDLLEGQMHILGTIEYLNKVYDCLLKFSKIKIEYTQVDRNLINLNNGIYNIATSEFYEPNSNFFIPFSLDVNYNSFNTSCPNFDKFLFETSCGDTDWITRMWEIIGYILSSDNKAKSIFIFQGKMDSGKSLLASFLQYLFPQNITLSIDLIDFQTQFGPSNVSGKTLCICPDLNPNSFKNISMSWLKRFSGGDIVSTPVKYRKENLTFRPEARFILCTNHSILTESLDPAFIRRLVVLPFCRSVPLERQDKNLFDKILREKNAIFTKALIYVKELRERNYVFTGNFQINQKECFSYENNVFSGLNNANNITDLIENFLLQTLDDCEGGFITTDKLYEVYIQNGGTPMAIQKFSRLCLTIGSALFPMQKTKRRIPNMPNPVNGFSGVKFNEV